MRLGRSLLVGLVLAGVIFGLMHLPFAYFMNPLPVAEFLAASWPLVLIPFCWHFVLWYLYARFNSLAALTLMHMALNLAGDIM